MIMTTEMLVGQCKFLMWTAEPMLEGLEDKHLTLEPTPGNKTAGWLLGHLCITGNFARRLCGRPGISPREWRSTFSPGTHPGGDAPAYPPMAELCRNFREIYADLCDAIVSADDATMSGENPFEPARSHFPTSGEFVSYIVTGHLGYHLAQLGDWRRAAGLGHKGYL